ncbi:RDD family protein [Bacillus amyloliquefaciens]|uniref:RDD family protein n=1 Tax=Bacillus amyloliquefaciens TaxID=1390 RepID=UPI0022F3E0D7|nr:RDD family protein [Bacillus amyloliquefaciens]WBY33607.1 RDD family protein [Bacillus amyloliquefaciens]
MERPAGFWIRFLAYVIDQIIIGIQIFIIQFIVTFLFAAGAAAADPLMTENQFTILFLIFGVIPILLISIVISILYFSLLTASKMQGTLGKALLGLKVVNEGGGRISIGQAFGRAFASIISKLILYIGFIMAAFGEKKTLHDIICSTRVVYK